MKTGNRYNDTVHLSHALDAVVSDIAIRAHLNGAYRDKPSIDAWGKTWMERNKALYEEFKRFAFELLMAGANHLSADMVAHRVRFETAIRGKGDGFKLNNNAVRFMAERFMEENPHLDGIFERRKRK